MSLLWPDEEQLEELRQMLEAADTPSLTDETIWNVVKEQGENIWRAARNWKKQ